jgi:hypothetical protein
MISIKTILGIKTRDPHMPGRLYLSDEGTLTRDPKKAKLVSDNALHKAIREVKTFSHNFFTMEVACPENHEHN